MTVSVSRRVEEGGATVEDWAQADVEDGSIIDGGDELARTEALAQLLFQTLPILKRKSHESRSD